MSARRKRSLVCVQASNNRCTCSLVSVFGSRSSGLTETTRAASGLDLAMPCRKGLYLPRWGTASLYRDNSGLVLTPMYNCARIKLTAPRDGCKLWSMRFIMYPGGSHDQEQDREYDTRIVSTREVHSRHRHHVRVGQEYGAQVSASSGTLEHAPSAAQSSLETGSLQRADQAVDQGGSLLQL